MNRIPLESHRAFYLTLISMIQSLAFGYLLATLDLTVMPTGTQMLQICTTFVLIVVVWHEYAVSTMMFVWLIDLWDSLIPFIFRSVPVFSHLCTQSQGMAG